MKLLQSFIAILLSCYALTCAAQAADAAPWYDIELILFKQGSSGNESTENWPEDPGSPDWANTVSLHSAPADDPFQPYTLLPKSSWRLNAEYNALQRTRGEMEPLFHQAWRQPVTTRNAEAIYLGPTLQHPDGSPPAPFEGVIKISVNRYLHVDLDLLLRGANELPPPASPELLPSPNRGSIRFVGKRRMRSGELHYIDHPRMGALILISRIEPPKPEPVQAVEPAPTAITTPEPDSTPKATDKPLPPASAN